MTRLSEFEMKQLYPELMERTIPKFCPGCGKKLVRIKDHKIWIMPYMKEAVHIDEYQPTDGFDCYCDKCEWSGDIEPDILFEFNEVAKEEWRQK